MGAVLAGCVGDWDGEFWRESHVDGYFKHLDGCICPKGGMHCQKACAEGERLLLQVSYDGIAAAGIRPTPCQHL